jgi:hypothetical protein
MTTSSKRREQSTPETSLFSSTILAMGDVQHSVPIIISKFMFLLLLFLIYFSQCLYVYYVSFPVPAQYIGLQVKRTAPLEVMLRVADQ